MAPFRMPFSNRKGPIAQGQEPSDENARPGLITRGSGSLGLKTPQEEPTEYKLSCQSHRDPEWVSIAPRHNVDAHPQR